MRWALLMILLLSLTACSVFFEQPAPAAPVPVAPAPVVQPSVNATAPAPAAPAPAENESAPAEETSPAEETHDIAGPEAPSVAQFIDIFHKDVKNYKFTYKNDLWMVQGKQAKVVPFRTLQNVYAAPMIDTIYFDLDRRTAVGVCEGRDTQTRKQCASRKILGVPYALPYVQFKIKLPEEWLTEFQSLYLAEAETPKINTDRPTTHLKYLTHTRTTDLYIDESSGLPVAVIDDGTEYHYELLAKNAIKPTELLAPKQQV